MDGLTIKLFGKLAEVVGTRELRLPHFPLPTTIAQLRAHLMAQSATPVTPHFAQGRALVAINQTLHNNDNTPIHPNDEVAFFPPVSGG